MGLLGGNASRSRSLFGMDDEKWRLALLNQQRTPLTPDANGDPGLPMPQYASPPPIPEGVRQDVQRLGDDAWGRIMPRPDFNDLPEAKAYHPKFLEKGGVGGKILKGLGEFALAYSAGQGNPMALATLQNRMQQQRTSQQWAREDAQSQAQRRQQLEDRDWKAGQPDDFMSGGDRVRYDPKTKQTYVLYQAPEQFEKYAGALGFEKGTPEYNQALQDYVLRGNGPTALGYDEELEGVRQGNRLQLRGMPTYGQSHPRPVAPRRGGGTMPLPKPLGGVKPPTVSGPIATNPKTGERMRLVNGKWIPVR